MKDFKAYVVCFKLLRDTYLQLKKIILQPELYCLMEHRLWGTLYYLKFALILQKKNTLSWLVFQIMDLE